jgi:hypothetical protein
MSETKFHTDKTPFLNIKINQHEICYPFDFPNLDIELPARNIMAVLEKTQLDRKATLFSLNISMSHLMTSTESSSVLFY